MTNTLSPTVNLTSDNLLSYTSSSNYSLSSNGINFKGSSLASNSDFFNIWGNNGSTNGTGYNYFNNYDSNAYSNNYYSGGRTCFKTAEVGSAAVPLPAASWMGLALLGAMGGLCGLRRTRQA